MFFQCGYGLIHVNTEEYRVATSSLSFSRSIINLNVLEELSVQLGTMIFCFVTAHVSVYKLATLLTYRVGSFMGLKVNRC